tara:strand:- start:1033 stop:1410 length:378 start_codon:yes stop_codon:yes gene_type:complete
MAKFSKVNLQNIVTMVDEHDHIEQAEYLHGGNWLDYQLSNSFGDVGKIYDPVLNIYKHTPPVDIVGAACSSWTLNTSTGDYEPPITQPVYNAGITSTQDDEGISAYWKEADYQADNNVGWALTTK